MDAGSIINIIILVVLIALSAFFSSAETALTTVSKFSLRSLADNGNKRASRVLKVTENSSKLISTILIGNNIVNISASSLTTTFVTKAFGSSAVGIATGALTLIVLLFGEITPKTLAQRYNLKISLLYIDIIQFLMIVLTPVIFIVNKIADFIFWIIRLDKDGGNQKMTEDELISMVNVSEEEGVIEDKEKEMITNVVDFGDSIARDVMIPRADMTIASVDMAYDDLLKLYMEVPYTRIPVYEDSRDNVIGILHVKDLFFYKATHDINNFSVRNIMRKPLYVYEYQKTNDLLHSMKSDSNTMAIVLDEYGICIGLITIEDLIEEIIGDIKDEYDTEEHNNIIKVDDTHYNVDGSIKLDGVDMLNAPEEKIRAMRGSVVSMIFQDPMSALNPVMTVGAQIMEVLKIHHPEQSTAQLEARVDEMMELVGIPAKRKVEYPHQFSGGMKQRIVIAIALACEPKLILADEPTTALDVTIQAQMLGLINELQKRLNTAMILITHDLGVVAQTCEKVMVMYAGEAIEYGTAEDIFETTQRHPYTQGLFNAIPKLDENTKRLEAIEGMMADPTQKIEGCRFADRCKYATAACKKAQKMREGTPGHFIRCCRFDPPQSNT